MVKEEETITEAAGGAGGRGYMDLLGEDYYLCMSPSSYFSTASSTTTTTNGLTSTALLSFHGQEHHDSFDCFQYHGSHAPVVVPQKSSPTTECSSSISMSSPTATVSSSKPHTKKKGRGGDQKKATASAAAAKKPRATASTTATTTTTASGTIKVRKERLGERILALQQLVSPFGKSDTASVLHEALGYIRFLHDQVQALSSPYMLRLPSSAHAPAQDLRSRGLCLVPVSCTEHVAGNGNGADLWSAAAAAAAGKNVCATAFRNDI